MRTKMSDEGWAETKFQFHLSGVKRDWKNARPIFGKYRFTPQARQLSGSGVVRRGRLASGDSDGHEARAYG